jgi:hypothetical protein
MKYFDFNGEVQCFVRDYNVVDYFYVEITGFGFPVRLFTSLSIADFFGRLTLLSDFRKYVDENGRNIKEAFHSIVDDKPKMLVIEKDIEEIIELREYSEVESEYFDFEEHDTIDEGFERYELLSDFKSKTVH